MSNTIVKEKYWQDQKLAVVVAGDGFVVISMLTDYEGSSSARIPVKELIDFLKPAWGTVNAYDSVDYSKGPMK